jgi:hypothetical protein
MKKLILLFLICAFETSAQSTIRLYFNEVNGFYKQTIIAFTDSTSDGVDVCCDAFQFGAPEVSIWTEIEGTRYVINSFGPMTEDREIPIKTSSYTNNGYFLIGVDLEIGERLSYRLLDAEFPGQLITLPYLFSGPIYEDRFTLRIDQPTKVEVTSGCEAGKLSVDNDDDGIPYQLYSNGELINEFPSDIDTIFNINDGEYQLIGGEFAEVDSFVINNVDISASLFVSAQNVWITDAYIEGIVTIYTPFQSIHWDFGDGTFVNGDLNPVHLYTNSGVYVLKVTIRSEECEKVLQTIITVGSPNNINQVANPVRFRAQTRSWDLAGRRVR